jgi:4-hydroxybenzoate polyprenyltransferase
LGYEQKYYFCQMNVFNKIIDFYINASIHVAFAVYAFLRITELYLEIPYQKNLNYFIFFGTITGYNFVKFAGVAKLHHRSLTRNLKIIQIFSFFCFLAMCFYAFSLPINTLLLATPFTFLTILYAVPFLSGFEKNLRNIWYLKIIIVALVWAAFSVIIPVFEATKSFSYEAILLFIQRFFILIVLILPFEIRDLQFDAISLQTIPRKIGIPKTKRLGLILMLFSLLISYALSVNFETKNAFMIFFFLVIVMLMRAKVNQSKYYSAFWVESLPIIWWLLLLGFHNF